MPTSSSSSRPDGPGPVESVTPLVSTPGPPDPVDAASPPSAEGGAVVAAHPGKARRRAIGPYVEQFLFWATEERDPADIPHFAQLGVRSIELGSWERDTLRLVQTARREAVQRPLTLLAEIVAAQAKFLDLLDRFDHGPMPTPSDLPVFLEQVVTDLAVGVALIDELQWDMNRLIGSGKLAEAKCLSRFQSRLRAVVSDVENRVGRTELELVRQRSQSFLTVNLEADLPETLRPISSRLEEDEPNAPGWAAYGGRAREPAVPPWMAPEDAEAPVPEEKPRAEPASRLRPLLVLLVVLVAVYAVVIIPRAAHRRAPVLDLQSFAALPAVEQVFPRPPSLYVQVDGPTWAALTPEQQLEHIVEIGRVAGSAGYSGAHVRTDDGATVGQWLKKTGARLVTTARVSS